MAAIAGKILCCLCGSPIEPNAAAMCIDCLRTQYSITDDIDRNLEIIQCKKCEKWNTKLDQWINHDMESTGLLNVCLKKVNALSKKDVKILHAAWVWTEPHSRRLKISVDIERGVLDGKVNMTQRFIAEFIVVMKQCPDCARAETDHTWGAMVQIRQHAGYKRSIYHLESLLIKSGLSDTFIDVEVKKDGFDVFFNNKNQAEKVADFISSHMPTRSKVSKKLVSHNTHTHKAKQEWTICLEIAGLAKDDLLLSDKGLTGSIFLMLVTKISAVIHLLNPANLTSVEITAAKYFAMNPLPLLTAKQLERYIVMNIELIDSSHHSHTDNRKADGLALAEAEVIACLSRCSCY
jgi:nonsense-mediated mRNA decay protein 3